MIGAGQLDDSLGDLDVLDLVAAADVVDLARPPAAKHRLDAGAVVLDVEPVANLPAVAVKRKRLSVERIGGEERNQLLGILVRAVGVRAARDAGLYAEGADVSGDVQVAGRLGDAVGAGRAERIGFARGAARLEVTVDLVGGDLDVAHPCLAYQLEQRLRTDELGAPEVGGAENRAIDMRIGGEVDDRLAP